VVKLGARQERVVRKEAQKNGDGIQSKKLELHTDADKENKSRVLLRNYRSKSDDVKWAHNGLVATVINGEAIPVVQNRV
ncbi:sulfate transporter, partial [Trifolium medium]|nr:sulfate transporter [Trifolium medium]